MHPETGRAAGAHIGSPQPPAGAAGGDGGIPLPLLVTGVAGVAGYNSFRHFRERFGDAVVGIRPQDNHRLAGPGIVPCNVEDIETLRGLFAVHGFRSVLDCAGNCALRACELDPALAWRLNVEGARCLLEAAAGREIRLIHLSVDLVFSGSSGIGGYREEDPPDPVTVYGTTMAAAEDLVISRRPEACVLRISLPMGVSPNGHAGAIDWIQSRFRQSKPATLYFDEVRTPVYTDCLNVLFGMLLANRLAGIYHAAGPRRMSLYEIAQVVNRVGGYDPRCLVGIPRRLAGPVPPRAGNVALDGRKLREALGCEPLDSWPADPGLVPAHLQWHHERPAAEEHSFVRLASVLYRNPRRVG